MGLFSKPPPNQQPQPPKSAANPYISAYTHLASLDRADEALKLLYQLASMAKPIMRKRNWRVGTLAEFLPDYHVLQGLHPHPFLLPAGNPLTTSPNSFFDMGVLMDTMLHELCHNVHSEHDKQFYGLLDQVKREWEMLSSRGYQGEGFFSQGQRLGTGHLFYKPSISTAASAEDRKRIKSAAERRAKGDMFIGQGRRLGDGGVISGTGIPARPAESGGGVPSAPGGRRLGRLGVDEGDIFELDIDPKQLAAMAAERRARDQKRCGAKHAGADMRRETERAQREGTTTQAGDIGNVINLDDLEDYDLRDVPVAPTPAAHTKPAAPTSVGGLLSSDWTCQKCTMVNPPLYLSCQVCHTERKLGDAGVEPGGYIDLTEEFAVSWDCKLCTFRNEKVTDGKCTVCGTEI